ncbi:hypothetical protein FACS1894199_06200 [Bacteroidia bacterium]|nr:hypothetical protein FACS1894199_06200 [Bacteroidia bacterium]
MTGYIFNTAAIDKKTSAKMRSDFLGESYKNRNAVTNPVARMIKFALSTANKLI